ncbi:hypothetical protein J7W19_28590 [Streptomyces mobaraensis NBRC 13819 = DSM 40847]|uniref:Putative secreted protein n=1 Tax=Streptomyces mobaraensis (strain ATCC 29032 / DSM 40847 / JCM 4168 / NBRC 13819 / NCIMB 11159 / IPCR 16-22) TaxID=1223523 RepID=M3A8K6_STRM1|nr:hypothetical protein [Streptomyces mobaraensis]EMF01479.1 putative secreted protein [Streptomyces mobaraensis NBRC 13819 = DSM 40847]QTT76807.1 hypothetical protein J7W19_28590 [Streptomyces mobaraensis NBRC 13819 = DSM 40847]
MPQDLPAPSGLLRPARRHVLGLGAALGGAFVLRRASAPGTGHHPDPPAVLTVRTGDTVTLARTTRLRRLTVEPDGVLTAPEGEDLTLTVDGVETGTVPTADGRLRITPGTYRGDVAVTVTERHTVRHYDLAFPFRQALYVGADGPDPARSVPAARRGGRTGRSAAEGLTVVSTGAVFNGVHVGGGSYLLRAPRVDLTGDGRCDFVGYGAALTATGPRTRLVVDGARITCHGVMRAALVATGGATVVVRNSLLRTRDGTLPDGYRPTVDPRHMRAAPWLLGITGNARTTNLSGRGTTVAYLASTLTSEGWGVLSSEGGSAGGRIAAVNSRVTTARSGYGSYVCDGVTQHLLGCDLDVADYAAVIRGGSLHYGDSTRAAVRRLAADWRLGLTEAELVALTPRATTIRSRRFGVMWHGPGRLRVDGGTVLDTVGPVLLGKGQPARITVDGSRGARLRSADGVLMQLMDDDDPGPHSAADPPEITGRVYRDPPGPPVRADGFDTTAPHPTDVTAEFTDTDLTGDFLNGTRGGTRRLPGLDLRLTLVRTRLTGVVSATTARHRIAAVDASRLRELGVVTNTASPVVNNGVVLTLGPGSRWTPTGTCHLSALHLDPTARLAAPPGTRLEVTVDGRAVVPAPGGGWTGAVAVRVRPAGPRPAPRTDGPGPPAGGSRPAPHPQRPPGAP